MARGCGPIAYSIAGRYCAWLEAAGTAADDIVLALRERVGGLAET